MNGTNVSLLILSIGNDVISFTAVNKYLSCPREYYLYYQERIRPSFLSSAFYFGKAVDEALGVLLTTRNLDQAKEKFNNIFIINEEIEWVEDDLDGELLTVEEFESEHSYYYSMKKKGLIILESFQDQIMPRIKNVIATQTNVVAQNEQGDKLRIVPDLIVEWETGETILFDIKTSAKFYEEDAARKSIQLHLYNMFLQEKYSINSIGFLVCQKSLKKNRVKICSLCGFNGTGGRHTTCPNKRNGERCGGKWNETIAPEAYIQVIISKPSKAFTQMVVDNLDAINYNIQHNVFYQNLNNCKRGKRKCDYYDLCHNGSMEGLTRKE